MLPTLAQDEYRYLWKLITSRQFFKSVENPAFIFWYCVTSIFLFQSIDGKVHFVYKKVAMVEQFFDIIYSVHVEAAGDTQIRGRAGKHCGQKRTYRAVSNFSN